MKACKASKKKKALKARKKRKTCKRQRHEGTQACKVRE